MFIEALELDLLSMCSLVVSLLELFRYMCHKYKFSKLSTAVDIQRNSDRTSNPELFDIDIHKCKNLIPKYIKHKISLELYQQKSTME